MKDRINLGQTRHANKTNVTTNKVDRENLLLDTLIEFQNTLATQIKGIYNESTQDNIVKEMLTLVYNSSVKFFDIQMHRNMPAFIGTLITMYPSIMTSCRNVDEIPIDEIAETSVYDHLHYSFYELLVNNFITLGVEMGVFSKVNDTINLTPYSSNSSSESQHIKAA